MSVEMARAAGFCYGVKRAVELAQEAARTGQPCVMLGPVIHNHWVIEDLAAQGVGCVDSVDEVPDGAAVIVRSHGEGRAAFQALEARGAHVIDATCPNVSKIHGIVQQAEAEGRTVLIIGAPTHPEVAAIAGWCEGAVVLENEEALDRWLTENPTAAAAALAMVSQTTSNRMIWDACREKAKKECTNVKIFDTICDATYKRQEAALDLASRCDAVVVVGDPNSSNTKRLAELCQKRCPCVLRVGRAAELDLSVLRGKDCVGITAGASTPGWIIKEVCDKMSDEIMEIEESFAELLEKSIKTLNTGEKVTGIITGIAPTEIYVDLGTKHAGYIPISELTDDPTVKVEDMIKIGDEIETYVMRVNDAEGVVTLSKKRLDTVKGWDDIERAREEGTIVEGIVTEENKGGIVVSVRGVRVFVPASQTGLPRDSAMTELVKQKTRLRITEVNRARRRVVGSIRAVAAEERAVKAAEVWETIENGKRYHGVVKSLTSYGIFVDIGGVDGMVHISELSWSRIKHPSEVVKAGDEVDVYVISFDPEKKKISLGMKDRSEDPWAKFTAAYEIGSVADARVVKLMTFGAFAEIIPGVDGLIHISQIADRRVERPGDVLAEGQQVQVKITDIDFENKKISLSIRALLVQEEEREMDEAAAHAAEPDALVAVSEEGGTEIAPALEEALDEDMQQE